MLGSISSRPCEAVKVVVSAPDCSAPCTAPAAPPSLCIAWTTGWLPQMVGTPAAAHSSANSAIVEDGVIGKIAITSLTRYAACAAAVLPSMVAVSWSMGPPPLSRRWFRDHLDRVARALLKTDRAAGAFRVIVPIALAGTQLDDRVLRTGSEAVVAFKAIAATQAAPRLAPRLRLGQAGQDLDETA